MECKSCRVRRSPCDSVWSTCEAVAHWPCVYRRGTEQEPPCSFDRTGGASPPLLTCASRWLVGINGACVINQRVKKVGGVCSSCLAPVIGSSLTVVDKFILVAGRTVSPRDEITHLPLSTYPPASTDNDTAAWPRRQCRTNNDHCSTTPPYSDTSHRICKRFCLALFCFWLYHNSQWSMWFIRTYYWWLLHCHWGNRRLPQYQWSDHQEYGQNHSIPNHNQT